MSSSASVIISEDDHHPIILYSAFHGDIASYSAEYAQVVGAGMSLYDMLSRYQKNKNLPGAETAANEFLLMTNGESRVADSIHSDIEYIYTMCFKTDPKTALRTCSLNAFAVTPWKFTLDSPFFKIRTWLSDNVSNSFFEHRYYVREIGSTIKKTRQETIQ